MSELNVDASKVLVVAGMLATGIANSVINKWQDKLCAEHCDPADPAPPRPFEQPIWQTLVMFVGESVCMLPLAASWAHARWHHMRARRHEAHERRRLLQENEMSASYGSLPEAQQAAVRRAPTPRRSRSWHPGKSRSRGRRSVSRVRKLGWRSMFLFAFPTACDITATTLMNMALLIMPVSIFQMTRGALVLWVGLFSVLILRHHLRAEQWLSLGMVVGGVAIVGLSGVLLRGEGTAVLALAESDQSPLLVCAGLAMVLLAQVFAALQFVSEERIMGRYSVEPALAVGLEGTFGLCMVLVAMPLLHLWIGRTPTGRGGYFDMVTGWRQLTGSPQLLTSACLFAACIAMYNLFGLNVTRLVSATSRSTLDTCRSLGVWVVSVFLGWEVLRPLSGLVQCAGFALLAYGTFVFNGLATPPRCTGRTRSDA